MLIFFNGCLFAQDLDGKTFIIQNNGAKVESNVLGAFYNQLGKNGTKIQLSKRDTSLENQSWTFKAVADTEDKYYIINQCSKAGKHKYLEANWTTLGQDGGRVQLWEFNGTSNLKYGANQIWQITKNKNGSYTFTSAHPKSDGKVLEADSFSKQKDGYIVHLYFETKKPDQTWNLLEKK